MTSKLTRAAIANCPNELSLVELHYNANKNEPDYNRGSSVAFARNVMQGRLKKLERMGEVKATVRYFNDTDGD